MGWKKVVDSPDLIVLERKLKHKIIRIEARNEHKTWNIYKSIIKGKNSKVLQEFVVKDKKKVHDLIESMKGERFVPVQLNLEMNIKRRYKEDFVEKWSFTINNDVSPNFLIIRFDDEIIMDIVVHEKFHALEEDIVEEIKEKLGLDSYEDSLSISIFYFREAKRKRDAKKNLGKFIFGHINIEFGMEDE